MNRYLYDNFHQVLLRNDILAADDLLKNARENVALIHVQVDAIQLTKSDQIGTNENAEVPTLHLAFLAVS